jgi:hypothetical protein
MTSDQLDALYDRIATLEAVAAGNKRHVQLIVPDLERAEAERDGAYRERAHLVAHLAAIHPSHIGYTDPNAPDWAVVIIETPTGQMSWHIADRDMDLFGHVRPTNRICRGWDGHTTDEKYERLQALVRGEGVPLFRAERAEAAIARVRDAVAALHTDAASARQMGHETSAYAIAGSARRITYALDGPGCSPAARETEPNNPTDWTPPPPGDTREQLPDHILNLIGATSYRSTACETANLCDNAIIDHPAQGAGLRRWRDRMHSRCRLNNKFTGVLCECFCHMPDEEPGPA